MAAKVKAKPERAVRARVRGALTGVGFRAATVDRALELGLLGWVRNDDGEVLVHAEGSEEAVAALLQFLDGGPDGPDVEQVAVEEVKPEGHEQFAIRGVSAGPFEVRRGGGGSGPLQLRLEVDGEIRAWALPKGPSMDPAVKRMALEAGAGADAGGGETVAWDRGSYEQGGRVAWPEAIERGHAVFVLHGEKLNGGFALQRIRPGPKPQWLLIKRKDEQARPSSDVVAGQPDPLA